MFLVRYSKEGLEGNKYYYTNPYNTEEARIQLPNCTCFSQGSGQESGGLDPTPIGSKNLGSFGNAKTWLDKSPLPKGRDIKEGCIVVYDGTYGHVLKVEKIIQRISDDHCICRISQSNYVEDNRTIDNPNYYQSLIYEIQIGEVTKGVGLVALGCLYPEINDKRVERDKNKYQVEITYERMKARNNNMEWIKGMYIPLGIYNVIKKQEKEIEGIKYQCVKLDENVWCALVEDCYIEYEKDTSYEALYKDLRAKVDKFMEEVN